MNSLSAFSPRDAGVDQTGTHSVPAEALLLTVNFRAVLIRAALRLPNRTGTTSGFNLDACSPTPAARLGCLQGSLQQIMHCSPSDLLDGSLIISTCLQEQLSTMLGGPGASRGTVSCLDQPQPLVSFVRAPLNPVGRNTAVSAAGPGGRTKQQGGQREGKHHSAQQVAFMWSPIRPCLGGLTCRRTHVLHAKPQRPRAQQTAVCPALIADADLCASTACRCHNTLEFSRQPATPQATRRACCKARHSSSCKPTCSSRHG